MDVVSTATLPPPAADPTPGLRCHLLADFGSGPVACGDPVTEHQLASTNLEGVTCRYCLAVVASWLSAREGDLKVAAAVAAAAPPPDLVVTDLVKLVNAGAALAYAIYHGGVEFALAMPPAVVAAYGRACRAYQIGRHAR